jgi:diphosphate-dependent phosphofructokinase
MQNVSPLQIARLGYVPELPDALKNITVLDLEPQAEATVLSEIKPLFPNLSHNPLLKLVTQKSSKPSSALKVGVVLSGGQAPGGHNVIAGIFDALKQLNPQSKLIGFLGGPSGILKNQYKEITEDFLSLYRNQGGFDIIGSGRTKIETDQQFNEALTTLQAHDMDALIVIGGDDSNTNAAVLAEFLCSKKSKTKVVGVPKTIDGDLQTATIEISFGFDSACKTYSEIIGNICKDALSAKKYYYFIKLMGRSASHITLDCALATQPNLALIAEEVQAKSMTLEQVVQGMADLVVERSKIGKDYGIFLIPEGIVEFLGDFKELIRELNKLLATTGSHFAKLESMNVSKEKIDYVLDHLSKSSKATYAYISEDIQLQLLLDRDPHGNVQVSKIETERLFIHMVAKELKERAARGFYKGKFAAQPIFCGYEGRSCLPSNFDCNYCYALGSLAALIVARGYTGYIASLTGLSGQLRTWNPSPTSLVSMLHLEERDGKTKPVIEKALVDLKGMVFSEFYKLRDSWRIEDTYIQPGPIQFFGPDNIVNTPTATIAMGK